MRPILPVISLWLSLSLAAATPLHALERSDTLTRRGMEALGVSFTQNNTVVLLPTGREKFDALFAAIRQARHYIHLEYFNFRNDSIGMALFDLLGEKAREGVEVRALYDSFGNSSNDSPLKKRQLKQIRESGVEVCCFAPIHFPWVTHFFHRDHCKIVVIDGAVAYAGGMNVADYYIHGRPEYGEWRDMHMELTGDVVDAYEAVFARMWWEQTRQILLASDYGKGSPRCRDASEFVLLRDTTATAGRKQIGVVHRRPGEASKLMRKAYTAAIDAAQHKIQIVNPYPTSVSMIRQALYRALERGVKVEFMVSARMDEPVTPDIVALEMHHFVERGADVFYNQTGFHHSKIMMIDGSLCTVGSANMDGRSMRCDYEVNAFILDAPTTQQLQAILEADKANCTRYTAEGWKDLSCGHRFVGKFFYPFRLLF